jgi:hypothetical protein
VVLGPVAFIQDGVTKVLLSARTRAADADAVSMVKACMATADRTALANAVVSISTTPVGPRNKPRRRAGCFPTDLPRRSPAPPTSCPRGARGDHPARPTVLGDPRLPHSDNGADRGLDDHSGGCGRLGSHISPTTAFATNAMQNDGPNAPARPNAARGPGLQLDLMPGRQNGPGGDPLPGTTRLVRATGFTPTFDVATAVADYVAWRAHNPR